MRTWADDFNTYREACIYYGADTPENIAYEFQAEAEEAAAMEAEYGPYALPPFEGDPLPF